MNEISELNQFMSRIQSTGDPRELDAIIGEIRRVPDMSELVCNAIAASGPQAEPRGYGQESRGAALDENLFYVWDKLN